MTLQDYSFIALIITSIANVFFLGLSTAVAFYLYKWNIENSKIEACRRLTDDWRHYNEMVLNNEDLQMLCTRSHRWGIISKDDVIKMYRYFIFFNISHSLFIAYKRNSVDLSTYQSQMNNAANTSFIDRDFIKQHVLPRGYPNDFRKDIQYRWEEIDKNGTVPCV